MFGLPEALMSLIRRQVGLRTDVASSTGSLHAKVKDIADNQLPTLQKPRGTCILQFFTDNTTLTTVCNVSGKGELLTLIHRNYNATGDSADYKVIIDGTTIIYCGTGPNGFVVHPTESYARVKLLTFSGVPLNVNAKNLYGFSPWNSDDEPKGLINPIPFNESLVIQAAKIGTNSVVGSVIYSLE